MTDNIDTPARVRSASHRLGGTTIPVESAHNGPLRGEDIVSVAAQMLGRYAELLEHHATCTI